MRTTDTGGDSSGVVSPSCTEILRGCDGRDGLPGRDGKDGEQGEQGQQGEQGEKGDPGTQGPRGLQGPPGADGRNGPPGRDGINGVDGANGQDSPPGLDGRDGVDGDPGAQGPRGLQGPPGPAAQSGVVYTRWGRTTCPSGQGTELVYSGRAGGSHFLHKGGAANYLCMPDNPQYSNYARGVQGSNYVFGTEYQLHHAGLPISHSMNDHNVPCAVCSVQVRGRLLMIPARKDCPASWTKEYEGALMSQAFSQTRSMYECVDKDAESVPRSAVNTNGALFYPVEANCNGMSCPPYDPQKELLCVVCTK